MLNEESTKAFSNMMPRNFSKPKIKPPTGLNNLSKQTQNLIKEISAKHNQKKKLPFMTSFDMELDQDSSFLTKNTNDYLDALLHGTKSSNLIPDSI